MVITVIGGGPAGMMAAWKAKQENQAASVFLLEKNEKLGKKIFITGKGRGNLTNACELSEFFPQYVTNSRFLYPALYEFTNADLIRLMEKGGCRVKTERGKRVFPVSDRAYSITDCLKQYLKKAGVHIALNTEVRKLVLENGRVTEVITNRESYRPDSVIVATGGLSYPSTGSTGDGYRFAEEAGLDIVEPVPSLVHLEAEEEDWYALRGLKLKNISIDIRDEDGKSYYQDFGELDFSSAGIAGPIILSASAKISRLLNTSDRARRKLLTLHINLKPVLEEKTLDERLQKDFRMARGAELRRALDGLLPGQLLPVFLRRLEKRGMNLSGKVDELPKQKRREIVSLLSDFPYTLRGTGGFREAIVTQGGVSVREIDPKTMASRKVPGLFFAGEVLDVDAFTGGFNMQSAFSTGYLAGKHAARLQKNL